MRRCVAGGPVGLERGFVLHNASRGLREFPERCRSDIQLTVSRDVIDAMAERRRGPSTSRWSRSAMQAGKPVSSKTEILANSWINVPASAANWCSTRPSKSAGPRRPTASVSTSRSHRARWRATPERPVPRYRSSLSTTGSETHWRRGRPGHHRQRQSARRHRERSTARSISTRSTGLVREWQPDTARRRPAAQCPTARDSPKCSKPVRRPSSRRLGRYSPARSTRPTSATPRREAQRAAQGQARADGQARPHREGLDVDAAGGRPDCRALPRRLKS
jgi:hypothetical protein